uniref:VWFC domain-containing protein n=1 Tax=Mesocestoides corti TaxID=53468 RepID=A0A5K3EIB6_MESCO
MAKCSDLCPRQRPLFDNGKNVPQNDCAVPGTFICITKLGYDADQMPLALRPKCPCCGCRQNPMDDFRTSEIKRDGCAFDPCSPCHKRLYEDYIDSFAICAQPPTGNLPNDDEACLQNCAQLCPQNCQPPCCQQTNAWIENQC